jgi:hypothetical protein
VVDRREVDDVAARQRDVARDARALGADGLLRDLDEDLLALADDLADGRRLGGAVVFVVEVGGERPLLFAGLGAARLVDDWLVCVELRVRVRLRLRLRLFLLVGVARGRGAGFPSVEAASAASTSISSSAPSSSSSASALRVVPWRLPAR